MEQDIKQTFDGGITEAHIDEFRRKHRKVIRIDVVDDGELHIGYFRRPDMATMGAVTKLAKTDDFRSSQALFDGCWLGGSEYLKSDSVLFISCIQQLNKAFEGCMASLKNV